jgi:hypothetical protein
LAPQLAEKITFLKTPQRGWGQKINRFSRLLSRSHIFSEKGISLKNYFLAVTLLGTCILVRVTDD